MNPSKVKTAKEIELMKKGGEILSRVLLETEKIIKVGMSTSEVDQFIAKQIKEYEAEPSFLGYKNYPAVSCVSINDEIVHGIPTERKIKNGQIVGIDIGIRYQSLCLDMAKTITIGEIPAETALLIEATKQALESGIKELKPGVAIGTISAKIQERIEKDGFWVIRELAGHGIGKNPQEAPSIPNYGREGEGEILKEGMVICLEPMASLTKTSVEVDRADGWTIHTANHSLAAHFEKTILITKTGSEVLTDF